MDAFRASRLRKTSRQVKPDKWKIFLAELVWDIKRVATVGKTIHPFSNASLRTSRFQKPTTWKLSLQRIHKNLVIANSWEQGGTQAVLNKGNRSRQRQQGTMHIYYIYVCMHMNSNIHMKVPTFEINDLLPKLLLHHINDRHYPSDSSWIITNP